MNGSGASSELNYGIKTAVAKITLGAGASSTVELWVGPVGAPVDVSGAALLTVTTANLEGVDGIRIMGQDFGSGVNSSFDNLLVGTNVADVDATDTPPAPAAATWTNPAGGLWGTAGNWLSNLVGSGSGSTADFNTLNIAADTTVNLDSARTIGHLVFGDTDTSSAAGWTLANNGNAGHILTLAGTTPTITVNALGGTKTVTISAAVAGTDGLTKAGDGTLTLSGANTYSGGTTVSNGALALSQDSAAGSGAISLADTRLVLNAGIGLYEGSISASGLDTTTANPNTAAQRTTVKANVSNTGWSDNQEWIYSGYVNAGAGGVWTFGENIDDATWLKIDDSVLLNDSTWNNVAIGTVTLTSGWHRIDARFQNGGGGAGYANQAEWAGQGFGFGVDTQGRDAKTKEFFTTLQDPGDGSLLTHDLNVANAVNLTTGTCELNAPSAQALVTLSGAISGAGNLSKTGTGRLWLSGDNSYSGGTTINGGTLVAERSALGTGAVTVNSGGTLYANDQWVLCGANAYGVAERNVGTLTINAGGTLHLDPVQGFANGVQNLYLNGGSVIGGFNSDVRGALFLYNGNEQITAGGATNSTIAVSIGLTGNNNAITVSNGSSLDISGELKNADWFGNGSTPGGFIKAGTGTLTLSGANSYSGATTVNNGTLKVSGQSYFNVGRTTTVASGAVLELHNSDNSLTTLMPVSSVTGAGTFRLSGNSTIFQSSGGSPGTRLTFAMLAGGLIDLLDTSRLSNGGWQELDWSNNKASMNIASGATFDIWDA